MSKLLLVLLTLSLSVPVVADENMTASEGTAVTVDSAAEFDAAYDLDEMIFSTDEAAYEDMQRRRPRPPARRRPPRRNEPWHFLGCTNFTSDCSYAAFRYGFREYRTEFDIRCRRAIYACYARNRF
jgi:hypothetical protein